MWCDWLDSDHWTARGFEWVIEARRNEDYQIGHVAIGCVVEKDSGAGPSCAERAAAQARELL